MLAEFLEKITELTTPDSVVTVEAVNGRDVYVYSPKEREYEHMAFIPRDEAITVSEIDSLVKLVKLEGREQGAVVVFDATGATFLPGCESQFRDTEGDEDAEDRGRVATKHRFVRRHSPQWSTLAAALKAGTTMTHLQFLRVLQSLRPSIVNYAAIYSAYQRISLEAGAKATSAPIVMLGDSGATLALTVEVKSGKAEVKLPSEFAVEIPLTRFGAKQSFTVEVDAQVKQENGALLFGLIAPEMALAEEAAIVGEVESFRELVKGNAVTVLVNL